MMTMAVRAFAESRRMIKIAISRRRFSMRHECVLVNQRGINRIDF